MIGYYCTFGTSCNTWEFLDPLWIKVTVPFQNPLTESLLLFISFFLPSMDKFNPLFQKPTQNTTCQLYTEMSRLVLLYASNLLKPECIVAVGDDLSKLNLATRNQLQMKTWTWSMLLGRISLECLQKMLKKFPCGDFILKNLGIINLDQVCTLNNSIKLYTVFMWPLYSLQKMLKKFPCGDFILKNLGIINPDQVCTLNISIKLYTVFMWPLYSLQKMLKKFPFGDFILKNLGIINPDQVCTCDFTTVEGLAKHFPQLSLND